MYNKIFLFLILLIALATGGCNDGFQVPEEMQPGSPGTLTLRLRNASMTRSTDSDNSEWRIDNLILALYPGDSDDEEEAVVWKVYKDLNTSASYSVTIPLTAELVEALFKEPGSGEMGNGGVDMQDLSIGGDAPKVCRFVALANVLDAENISGEEAISEKSTVKELREIAIEAGFSTKMVQESFVMVAEGEAEYEKPADAATLGHAEGSGMLVRAAAKILLNVKFSDDPVEVKNENGEVIVRWEPVIDQAEAFKVLLTNGVRKAVTVPENFRDDMAPDMPDVPEMQALGGGLVGGGSLIGISPWKPSADDPEAYYSSDLGKEETYRTLKNVASTEAKYPWQMDVPFYSYPNAWEETSEETHKTHLTLIVPWRKTVDGSATGDVRNYYYLVPVTNADFIARNCAYIINLTVGMLGSIVPDEPMLLEDLSYEVVEWGTEEIDVEMQDIRYLVVTPNQYVINNESLIKIPFYTSHPVKISNITMTYQRFNYPSDNSGEMVEIPISKEVIDRSTWVRGNKTDTICNYTIVRDELTKMLTLQIYHPMILWTPKRENNTTVSLQRVGDISGLQSTINSIYKYDPPTGQPEAAYSPYFFEVTLEHEDNDNFRETVWITQYPGMYIVVDKNPGGSYLSKNTAHFTLDIDYYNYGFTFLNAKKNQQDDIEFWQNADTQWETQPSLGSDRDIPPSQAIIDKYRDYLAKGLGGIQPLDRTETVKNQNMYLINITQLAEGEEYIIGETRSSVVNNDLSGDELPLDGSEEEAGEWCNPADALYDTGVERKRRLKYYHPTNEDESYKWRVAPKLRISSAYGLVRASTDIVDRAIGRRRAATYQEQGYPAGRWRLPTYGEVKLIVTLSGQGKIPTLFNPTYIYLTAQGPYRIINNNGDMERVEIPFEFYYSGVNSVWQTRSSNGCNVRPVYDEWYWEDENFEDMVPDGDGGYVYTYGDMPIK